MSRPGPFATFVTSLRSSWIPRLALAAIPLVGVVELALHVKQTKVDVVPDADWDAARQSLANEVTPDDLVLFSPFWTDPIGRLHFGDALAPRKHEARPDETRFARVFEVSIRGEHRPEIASFKKVSERRVGKITIGVYENPAPAKVLTDLLDLVRPERMSVALVSGDAETACPWQHGAGQPGGLAVPQGPAVPGDKFACSGGGYVGAAVLHALDHHPHLCLFATVPGGTGTLRIRARDVDFGETLHGHSGVQWVTERTPSDEIIDLSFSAFGNPIGRHQHPVGAGFLRFEYPTPELHGKRGELTIDVSGTSAQRYFCFEADTRQPRIPMSDAHE